MKFINTSTNSNTKTTKQNDKNTYCIKFCVHRVNLPVSTLESRVDGVAVGFIAAMNVGNDS
jgi:hypothetical protein